MTTATRNDARYVMSQRGEAERLVTQATYLDPFTLRLLREAGVATGMRVLDLGSGMGDVAFLAGRLVGPEGEVVGIDASGEMVAAAGARAVARGASNVRFIEGDACALDVPGRFDAVIGRLILMHVADPVAVLRSAARALRPGGAIAIHELDVAWFPSARAEPLWEQVHRWIVETFRRSGADVHMGLKLTGAFAEAGLASLQVVVDAIVGGGPDFIGYEWAASVMRGLLPAAERLGVARAEEVEVETLAQRLRAATVERGMTIVCPPSVGVWASTAAG